MRKAVRKDGARGTSGNAAWSADQAARGRAGDSTGAGATARITEAERQAAPPGGPAAESAAPVEPDGRPGVEPTAGELGGEAARAAAGADFAPEPASMSPAELVGLLELAKGLLVRAVGAAVKAPAELVEELAPIPPVTKSLLDRFAVDAVRYLPALNANAPLVGAVAFGALAALDIYGATKRLRAAGAESQREERARRAPRPVNHNPAAPDAPERFPEGPSAPFEGRRG